MMMSFICSCRNKNQPKAIYIYIYISPQKTPHRSYSAQIQSQNEEKTPPPPNRTCPYRRKNHSCTVRVRVMASSHVLVFLLVESTQRVYGSRAIFCFCKNN
jgi:hypothetical protein